MTEEVDRNSTEAVDRTGEFFSVGPPLHAVKPGYVRRAADDLLYQTLVAGNYAHVVAPDRTGKSSLIAATSARLQNNGFKVAVLNLRQIGERDGGSDAGRWYYSIAYRLLRQLRLKVDLQTWWQDNSVLSNRQRLVEFYGLLPAPDRMLRRFSSQQRAGFGATLLTDKNRLSWHKHVRAVIDQKLFVKLQEVTVFKITLAVTHTGAEQIVSHRYPTVLKIIGHERRTRPMHAGNANGTDAVRLR